MTTLNATCSTNSGYVRSRDDTASSGTDAAAYAKARAGTGWGINAVASSANVGQERTAGAEFRCYEAFLEFDTSGIDDNATIDSVSLQLRLGVNNSTTDFTINAYVRDYSTSVTTADFVAGASLSGLVKVATCAVTNQSDNTYLTFTNVAFPASINKAGVTRILLTSDRQEAGTQPTVAEYITALGYHATTPSKLDVGWTAAAASVTVTPTTVALTLATFAPAVTATAHQSVTPSTASLSLATFAPAVVATAHQTVIPGTLGLTLSTLAPTVTATAHQAVTPATGALVLATLAPSVTATAHVTVTPATASLAVTTFAPNVTATDHRVVVPSTASLSMTAFAPSVVASDHRVVIPATAALLLSAFAPDVVATAHQTVTPAPAVLSLTAFAPSTVITDHRMVTPAPAALVITGMAPSIAIVPVPYPGTSIGGHALLGSSTGWVPVGPYDEGVFDQGAYDGTATGAAMAHRVMGGSTGSVTVIGTSEGAP